MTVPICVNLLMRILKEDEKSLWSLLRCRKDVGSGQVLFNLKKLSLQKEVVLSSQAERAFCVLEERMLQLKDSPVVPFLKEQMNEPIKDFSS